MPHRSNSHPPLLVAMVSAMRPLHWSKNVLLAAPLIAGHQLQNPALWRLLIVAFIAFNLLASSMYLINDLLDRRSDAVHPAKRHRPIAAGHVPVPLALSVAVMLLVGGLTLAWFVNTDFLMAAICYLVLTICYSCYLKTKPILDVLCLAGLYSLRILAGGGAVSIFPSAWLLAFSMFFFLSLAFSKRHAELRTMNRNGLTPNHRRGYLAGDELVLLCGGLTCGIMAVLVLALYINSEISRTLYRQPQWLWLMCPVLLYWIIRLWLLAQRGVLSDDPIMFAVRDRVSWLVVVVALIVFIAATSGPMIR